MNRFPYYCTLKENNPNNRNFVPVRIDYDNQQVWQQRSQVSGDGMWWCFSEVTFEKNPDFEPLIQNTDQVLLPRHLTAENGAKGVLSGEFNEVVEQYDENGEPYHELLKVTVSWDTVKSIYNMIVSNFEIK